MAATLMAMVCSSCADKKWSPSDIQTRNTPQTLNHNALPQEEIAQLIPWLNQELLEWVQKLKWQPSYSNSDFGIKVGEIYNSQSMPHFKKLKSLLSVYDIYFEVFINISDNSINLIFQSEDGQSIMINGEPFIIKATIPITPDLV